MSERHKLDPDAQAMAARLTRLVSAPGNELLAQIFDRVESLLDRIGSLAEELEREAAEPLAETGDATAHYAAGRRTAKYNAAQRIRGLLVQETPTDDRPF